MRYSKAQIEALGGRPVRRHRDQLTKRERHEVMVVAKCVIEDEKYLEKLFAESGIDGSLSTWAKRVVLNLWYDIGEPVFQPNDPVSSLYENDPEIGTEGGWCLPHGGFWPYLDKHYLDISTVDVGHRIINLDEVYCVLRDSLKEEIKERKQK